MRGWRETTESPSSPWPRNPEISNPQLFLHEPLRDRSSQKALCWHFNSLPCSRSREPSTPSLPHPCQATEKGTPTLPSFSPDFPPAAASQAWTSCIYSHLSPIGTKRAQKGCLKSWSSPEAGDITVPFFFFKRRVLWEDKCQVSFSL